MKVLIIYATRGGTSKRCAEMLSESLASSAIKVDIFDIESNPPSPEAYDVAVVGGSIRMGSLNKKLKKYLKLHADALNAIQTAVFICCGLSEELDDYITLQVPKALNPSLEIHYFGGEVKPEKAKGLDKLVLKAMRSSINDVDFESPDPNASPLPEIIPENITRLSDKIRSLL